MQSGRRKTGESSDPYYDLIDDFDLIIASFQTQYGLRISRDLKGMKWNEFKTLLYGISPETPLGRIVSIRAEDDKEILKHFNKDQKRIRSEWRSRNAKKVTQEEMDIMLEQLKQGFVAMAGRGADIRR